MSKNEEGKPEPTLVYPSFIRAVAQVRAYGIAKYRKSEDWRTTPSIRHFDAMLRHILAFMDGEEQDKDSRLSHLYHAAANIMFEIERREGKTYLSRERLLHGQEEEVTCPRCKATDTYPSYGVWPCTNRCGYFVEPMLEKV